MKKSWGKRFGYAVVVLAVLAGCARDREQEARRRAAEANKPPEKSIFQALFGPAEDSSTQVQVNKYLWNASLEILNFLPVESVDPFSGVITTGYGTPPGGGRAYRATVLIRDAALDARSLKLSLQTSGGPASPDTVRAVEDAIFTRARELRIRDRGL